MLSSFDYDDLYLVVGAMTDKDHRGIAAAFADTDLVVTLDRSDGRRVADVSEVVGRDSPAFAPLFSPAETGRIDRGNSAAVASFAYPKETYSDVREAIDARAATFR